MDALKSLLSKSPVWSSILAKRICDGIIFSQFCNEFFAGTTTQNFKLLIEQTVSRIQRLMVSIEKNFPLSIDEMEQTCNALHLCSIFFNFLFSTYPEPKILTLSGCCVEDSSLGIGTMSSKSGVVKLIHSCIACVDNSFHYRELRDVAFFAVSFLLSIFSSQLYQHGRNELKSNVDDFFIHYIFDCACAEWIESSANPGNQFCEIMPVKFVKGLLINIVECYSPPAESLLGSVLQEKVQLENDKSIATNKGIEIGSMTTLIKEMLTQITGVPFEVVQSILPRALLAHISRKSPTRGDRNDEFSLRGYNFSKYPLSEKCSILLLLLLYYTGFTLKSRINPFSEAFCALHDENLEDDFIANVEMVHAGKDNVSVCKMHFELRLLHGALLNLLPSESSMLLLYTILHRHPTYLEATLCPDYFTKSSLNPPTCVPNLLSSVLKGLYNLEGAQSLDHLYMMTVNLLILIQHPLVGALISNLKTSAPWYEGHTLMNINLCDLIVLCVIRTIMHSLFRLRDPYLVHNCFAVILYIAPLLHETYSYTAERLVTVTCKLCQRLIKIKADNGVVMRLAEGSSKLNVDDKQRRHQKVSTFIPLKALEESVRVLIKSINISMRPSNRASNVYIAYYLIIESDTFLAALNTPEILQITDDKMVDTDENTKFDEVGLFSDALLLDQIIVDFVNIFSVISSCQDTSTADNAVKNLQRMLVENLGISCCNEDDVFRVATFSSRYHMVDAYEEGKDPSCFFIPYIWACYVRSTPDINWHIQNFAIVDPVTSGLNTVQK